MYTVYCPAGGEQGIHRVGVEDGEAENVQHNKPKIGCAVSPLLSACLSPGLIGTSFRTEPWLEGTVPRGGRGVRHRPWPCGGCTSEQVSNTSKLVLLLSPPIPSSSGLSGSSGTFWCKEATDLFRRLSTSSQYLTAKVSLNSPW